MSAYAANDPLFLRADAEALRRFADAREALALTRTQPEVAELDSHAADQARREAAVLDYRAERCDRWDREACSSIRTPRV